MSDFLAASQRAEYWINSVASIARYAELDNVELAYGMVETLKYRIAESGEALESRFEELAILSDSQVTFEGFGWHALNDARFPGVWSSAHEAVHGVTIEALEILAQPLEGITDQKQQYELFTRLLSERGHALRISMVEVAKTQERIRRERLKLLESKSVERESASVTKDATYEEQAIALFLSNVKRGVILNQKQLAEKVGCDPKTLGKQKAEHLFAVMEAYSKSPPPKGYKDSEGNIDAWE